MRAGYTQATSRTRSGRLIVSSYSHSLSRLHLPVDLEGDLIWGSVLKVVTVPTTPGVSLREYN
ncbi:hypothetical protein D3C80_50130 [compost metagenome]